jgi:hypothetical protein
MTGTDDEGYYNTSSKMELEEIPIIQSSTNKSALAHIDDNDPVQKYLFICVM